MAGTEAYIASVDLWAGNYAPRNWMFCMGQTIPINDYQALYALIGTTYGGDGRTTIGLPDLRGRVPVGIGNAPGLSNYDYGQMGGVEQVALEIDNMPTHNHQAVFVPEVSDFVGSLALPVKTGIGTGTSDPTGKYFGNSGSTGIYYSDYTADKNMAPVSVDISGSAGTGTVAVGNTGASLPFFIKQPYTALYFIICVDGIFPPRS